MFEHEIKFIHDFNVNKIKKLGSFFTLEQLRNSDIHPALLRYISAEIEFLIFEDRQQLLKNSAFDYSGEKISEYFDFIAREIAYTKRLSSDYVSKLILHAVSFTVNFLVRPKWALLKFVFDKDEAKSALEIRQILNYLYYYDFLKKILQSYINQKNQGSFSQDDLVELLEKIDDLGREQYQSSIIKSAVNSMAEFLNIGGVNRDTIPLDAIKIFLKEKEYVDHFNAIDKAYENTDKHIVDIAEINNIISSVPIYRSVQSIENTETEVHFTSKKNDMDLFDEEEIPSTQPLITDLETADDIEQESDELPSYQLSPEAANELNSAIDELENNNNQQISERADIEDNVNDSDEEDLEMDAPLESENSLKDSENIENFDELESADISENEKLDNLESNERDLNENNPNQEFESPENEILDNQMEEEIIDLDEEKEDFNFFLEEMISDPEASEQVVEENEDLEVNNSMTDENNLDSSNEDSLPENSELSEQFALEDEVNEEEISIQDNLSDKIDAEEDPVDLLDEDIDLEGVEIEDNNMDGSDLEPKELDLEESDISSLAEEKILSDDELFEENEEGESSEEEQISETPTEDDFELNIPDDLKESFENLDSEAEETDLAGDIDLSKISEDEVNDIGIEEDGQLEDLEDLEEDNQIEVDLDMDPSSFGSNDFNLEEEEELNIPDDLKDQFENEEGEEDENKEVPNYLNADNLFVDNRNEDDSSVEQLSDKTDIEDVENTFDEATESDEAAEIEPENVTDNLESEPDEARDGFDSIIGGQDEEIVEFFPEPEEDKSIEPNGPKHIIEISDILEHKNMTKIIESIFDYDMEDFANTIDLISDAEDINEAKVICEKIFSRNQVSPKSKEAVSFIKIISEYFKK